MFIDTNNNEEFNLDKFLADHQEFCTEYNLPIGQDLENLISDTVHQELATPEAEVEDLELEAAVEVLVNTTQIEHPGNGVVELERCIKKEGVFDTFFDEDYSHSNLVNYYLSGTGDGSALQLLQHSYAREALLDRARKNFWYRLNTPVDLLRYL